MSDPGLTISDLLPMSPLHVEVALHKFFAEGKQEPVPLSSFFTHTAEKRVRDVLHIRLLDVFLEAWKQYRAVTEAVESTRASRSTAVVKVLEHEITVTQHPELQIQWAGKTYAALRLDLELTAVVHGANLEITAGTVRSVGVGDVSVRLGLKYKDSKLIPDWESEPVNIPGRVNLS